MKYFAVLLSIFFLSCSSVQPTKSTIPTTISAQINSIEQLRKYLDTIISDSLFIPSRISIKVISLENDETLYEHGSKSLMHPASNVKLFTSSAALYILDTNYSFKTSIYIDSSEVNKKVISNVYIKGFGDPELTVADLDSIANIISQKGINSVEGDIIIDNSYFDDIHWGPGWMWDDEAEPDAPNISALSVNKNCVNITVRANSKSFVINKEPETDFISIINNLKIHSDIIQYPFKCDWNLINNTNTIILRGEISPYAQRAKKIAIKFPEIYFGYLFKSALNRAGINVNGEIRKGIVPFDAFELVQFFNSIAKTIISINKNSDNLSAENLLKTVAVKRNGVPGSTRNGISAIKEFISKIGIDTTKLSIVDGSGISRYNLMNAEQIVHLLSAVYNNPRIFPIFYSSLPIAGVDGTLSSRMTTYPLLENLRAKTGTLRGVSCLSGYVQTRDGEMLAFSIMMQNFITSAADYRKIQDNICNILANFSRKIKS